MLTPNINGRTLRRKREPLPFGPMRNCQAAIRGDRPTTRFAAPMTRPRERHLGLRRTTPARLAQAPADSLAVTPMVAIRTAARGHLGLGRALRNHDSTPSMGLRVMRRPDSITWSSPPYSVPHRARPRSAAPWRG